MFVSIPNGKGKAENFLEKQNEFTFTDEYQFPMGKVKVNGERLSR